MVFAHLLFMLLFAHCLADYPLQGDYIAQAKNRFTTIGKDIWPIILSTHAFIHGGCVYLVTGSLSLAFLEIICHAIIDFVKCEGAISFTTDQLLHVGCKILWAALLVSGICVV